jgi:uncharacterized protein (TIGR00251 family)
VTEFCRAVDDGVLVDIRVQPRASADAFAGVHDGALKVRITAPPVDGEANKRLLRFLAKQLRLPVSALSIPRGETGRSKQVLIHEPEPSGREWILKTLRDLAARA